jgi:hypothetical protein
MWGVLWLHFSWILGCARPAARTQRLAGKGLFHLKACVRLTKVWPKLCPRNELGVIVGDGFEFQVSHSATPNDTARSGADACGHRLLRPPTPKAIGPRRYGFRFAGGLATSPAVLCRHPTP